MLPGCGSGDVDREREVAGGALRRLVATELSHLATVLVAELGRITTQQRADETLARHDQAFLGTRPMARA